MALLAMGWCFFQHETTQKQQLANQDTSLMTALGDIRSQLNAVSDSQGSNSKLNQAIDSLNEKEEHIQSAVARLPEADAINQMASQLNTLPNEIESQLSDLKNKLVIGTDSKTYLEPTALPFKVVSIDVIGGLPYVSINYDNHIEPISEEDSVAGWQLTTVDYAIQTAEFVNSQQQYVKMQL